MNLHLINTFNPKSDITILEYKLIPGLTAHEKRIGKLTSNGEFLFIIKKDSYFIFKYTMNGIDEFKKIQIKVKKDEKILEKFKNTPITKS